MWTLHSGSEVTVLAGVTVTRKPDRISVTQPIADLGLKPGDAILRYAYYGDGEADIWVRGTWHRHYVPQTTEKDGTGCHSGCDSVVIEDGIKEWWVQVRSDKSRVGWVVASKNADGKSSNGNFGGLCVD
jgi:hypothetical protein